MKKNIDLGLLISRIAIGIPMLIYGVSKLYNGIDFIEDLLAEKGIPTFIAYGVYVGEVVAPVLLIAGLRTKIAGLIFAFNCLTAILLVQTDNINKMNESGGWALELLFIYMLAGLSFHFSGAGKYSLSHNNKWD
jgi:putative oxidoreductase